jgi:ABC-type branched-subunit amino acid transport system substrate-binding protein
MWRRIVGLGITAVTFAAGACKDEAVAPTSSLTPVAVNRAGIPGWRRKCFNATATPVTFGANWGLTNAAGAPDVNAPTLEQVELAKFEINSSCGVRVGSGRVGSPLAALVRDNQGSAARSSAATQELIAGGAIAVVGGGGTNTAVPAAQVAFQSNVPFGANQAGGDVLSGCTVAELADPTVIKSATPVYGAGRCWNNRGLVFRTRDTGYRLGQLGARYARETYPALTTAAVVYRDDDAKPTGDGLRDEFVALGGTVLAEAGHTIVGAGTTVAAFKTLLRTVTAGNPSIIVGSTNVPHLRRFIQAYVELRDDPTWTTRPANFSTLTFVWSATLADNYRDVGPAALAVLINQNTITTSAWDPNSIAFQGWLALYRSYNPNGQSQLSGFYMAAYDAMIVMALAVTAAGTTDPAAVAAKIREVANPPGVVVCPGQWRNAFRLLAKGKDINYEGALGPVDLDERGNATGLAFGIFKVQADGSTALVSLFGAGPQPACEYDDDEGDDED